MARSVRPELVQTDYELARFVRAQEREARRLGYPPMSLFARNISQGVISAAPVDDDPLMEAVGRFFFQHIGEQDRTVLTQKYTGLSERDRARAVGMSTRGLYDRVTVLLMLLKGYLLVATSK